jgi:hypothetical protein
MRCDPIGSRGDSPAVSRRCRKSRRLGRAGSERIACQRVGPGGLRIRLDLTAMWGFWPMESG